MQMAFFDKLKAAAETVSDKTMDMIEIGKLNSRITAENNAIAEAQKKIGGIVSAQYEAGESFPPEIIELCELILQSRAAIETLQSDIASIKTEGAKGTASAPAAASAGIFCTACGASNAPGAKFCCGCGGKLG
jgi:uncharacterized small protein (DUF1192 family)